MRSRTTALPYILVLSCAWPMLAGAAQASFNPDISLLLDGRATDLEFGDVDREVPGFLLSPEVGAGTDGFSLGEAELAISSNIDDRFYGYVTVALGSDAGETSVELEEAYIETLSLPDGLTLKAGRFLSHSGYQNALHPHSWDFVDASLPQQVLLGGNFADVGAQLRWVAPTDLYLELGAEVFQGDSFPAGGASSTWVAYAKLGGDFNDSHSWIAGLAHMSARATDREYATDAAIDPPVLFSGDSALDIIDFTWKWSPRGNWHQRNAVLSAAYYRRSEDGAVQLQLDPTPELGTYVGDQTGFYVQGTYMFVQRWRFGVRYDHLSADNTVAGLSQSIVLDDDAHSPHRVSAMLDFSHTEFSRIRLQYNLDSSGPVSERQIYLQYIMSMGPHGAHRF